MTPLYNLVYNPRTASVRTHPLIPPVQAVRPARGLYAPVQG
jgi:hypothetical protein